MLVDLIRPLLQLRTDRRLSAHGLAEGGSRGVVPAAARAGLGPALPCARSRRVQQWACAGCPGNGCPPAEWSAGTSRLVGGGEKKVLLPPRRQPALLPLLKVTRGRQSWGGSVGQGRLYTPLCLLPSFLGTAGPGQSRPGATESLGTRVCGPVRPSRGSFGSGSVPSQPQSVGPVGGGSAKDKG